MKLSILHISDLHCDPDGPINRAMLLESLLRDRDKYTSDEDPIISPPDLIIVSGDVAQGVKYDVPNTDTLVKRQYDEALKFLEELASNFVSGDKQRIVIVPGNHDVNDSRFREALTTKEVTPAISAQLPSQLFHSSTSLRWSWPDLALYEIVDRDKYNERLSYFANFYESFYGDARSYSILPSEQFDIFDFPDWEITVVGFSSCHNNDLLNRPGMISPDALAAAGDWFRASGHEERLRLAAWHHNVEGPPLKSDYMDPDVVQNFIDGGYSLGFHGHQHKPQFLNSRFRYGRNRGITLVSAGTLGGDPAYQFGRTYNIVEIDTELRTGVLHVREMQADNPAMAIWGPRTMQPGSAGPAEFRFDPPPESFVRRGRTADLMTKAADLFECEEFNLAVAILVDIKDVEPLASTLLLECLVSLRDNDRIVSLFDPPRSPKEAIALMDAHWAEGLTDRLLALMETPMIRDSADGAVIEMKEK